MLALVEKWHGVRLQKEKALLSDTTRQAQRLLQRPELGRWLMRISGLPVAPDARPRPGWRTYRICLYQDRILDVRMSEEPEQWLLYPLPSPSLQPVSPEQDGPELQLVKNLAARALYAAGIEAGQVTVSAVSPHRAQLVQVLPEWPKQDAAEWMREIRDWQETQRLRGEKLHMLGADPEFALRWKGEGGMAIASHYFRLSGTVGCDTTRYREELSLSQHPVGELRPEPSEDPDELFFRIRETLRLAYAQIGDEAVECLAGGMPFSGYPIGGHIHFSGLTPTFSLRRKLDAYLALPLVLLEDDKCRERRKRYGYLGDVREKEYGFEYRTLPSWLVHPEVARGVLHLAWLVAVSSANLQAKPHLHLPLIRAYYRGEKQVLAPYVRQIWEELRQLPGYRLSAVHLDRYFSLLFSGQTWPAEVDLKQTWNL